MAGTLGCRASRARSSLRPIDTRGSTVHVPSFRAARPSAVAVLVSALALTGVVAADTSPAQAQSANDPADEPRFSDIEGNLHAEQIGLIADAGIAGGYDDGTFRPRLDVRRDQMATFLSQALELDGVPAPFDDVPEENVHNEAIGALTAAEIAGGFTDGTYRPRNVVTRGQMARFLTNALDLPPGDQTFPDVPSTYVHAEAIAALASAGITAGFPDGDFRPNSPVKRDQMARFLATGLDLPREPEPEPDVCPGRDGPSAATSSADGAASTTDTTALDATSSSVTSESEDLDLLQEGDVLEDRAPTSTEAGTANPGAENLGAAVPGTAFPLSSVIRTSDDTLEVHTQDLATSRGARVTADGDITATTTIPQGRRTWATARIGSTVYAGQWGGTSGSPNLFRYSATANGNRTAQPVATVPDGGEFWTLAADDRGRLWAGTRAHASSTFRSEVGLGSGRTDGRHVIHRVDPSSGAVTNVLVCLPDPPSLDSGLRPDVKQIATAGETVYLGLGQQNRGARLYAFEPGDRTEVPLADVRDVTPETARSATSIFALTANDRHVAFGTQSPVGGDPRLVVLDRDAGEQVRLDARLTGKTRVDAVSLLGDRVVASVFTGELYDAAIPTAGSSSSAVRRDSPVLDQFHRYVEARPGGEIRGVSNRGIVWTLARGRSEADLVNLVDRGAPIAPGLPHSLHVTPDEVVVGSNSAVTFRSKDAPEASRTLALSGEVKAITSAPDGETFLGVYPSATLWHVEPGDDQAEPVRTWNSAFTRPADADHDDRHGRVLVVAREENAPQAEARPAPHRDFGFRASRLFAIDPASTATTAVAGRPLTRPTGSGSTPIEASRLLVGESESGSEVFVGDTRGGVQRVDAVTGARAWYHEPDQDGRYRRVVDLTWEDEQLVVTTSGLLEDRNGVQESRTLITVLDPETGDVVDPDTGDVGEPLIVSDEWAVANAVVTGDLVVMPSRTINRYYDRGRQEHFEDTQHQRNDSFGGPYMELDAEACLLYSFEDTPSDLVRAAPAHGTCDLDSSPPDDVPGDDEPGTDG
jgi:hypothetical protein